MVSLMRMTSYSHVFECLILSWCFCLGSTGMYGLIEGGMLLGVKFENSEAHIF